MPHRKDPVWLKISALQPKTVLDVGCGCGSFAEALSPLCGEITAIEPLETLVEWAHKEHHKPNITYRCMDGRHLDFADRSFELALVRDSLHHILEWHTVLDEMVRVSAGHILVSEPVDDPRSEAKRNAIMGQGLILELQTEVGYPHFRHIAPQELIRHLTQKHLALETQVIRNDETEGFKEFFEPFIIFAEKSRRKEHWLERLDKLEAEYKDKRFANSDTLILHGEKKHH
jgi:2-polyprenyl-3-methyl-5-hydroxy-6-metoxy-1,4-benzoquinol methylase